MEKLNAAGAGIRIVENLDELWRPSHTPLKEALTEPGCLEHLAELLGHTWLSDQNGDVQGEDFSGLTIASPNLSRRMDLERLSFSACDFTRAVLQRLWLGRFNVPICNCNFAESRLEELRITQVHSCEFQGVVGKSVELSYVEKCRFESARFQGLHIDSLSDCEFTACTIQGLVVEGQHQQQHFLRTTIDKSQIEGCEDQNAVARFQACTLTESALSKIKLRGMAFAKCDLRNVEFSSLTLEKLTFEDCNLEGCRFVDCQISHLDLGRSKITSSSMKGCDIDLLSGQEAQLKDLAGAPAEAVQDLSATPKVQELAKAIQKAQTLNVDLDVVNAAGDTVRLKMVKSWGCVFRWSGDATKKSGGSSSLRGSPPPSADQYEQCLMWLFLAPKIAQVNIASLKTKASQCPVKGKALKTLILEAVHEAGGIQAPSEKSLKQAAAQRRQELAKARDAVVAELQSGAKAKLKERSAQSLQEIGAIKKLKLSGVDLKGASLAGLHLDQCDCQAANLSGANFQEAVLNKCDFTGANLTKANLSGAKLKGSDFSGADLSGANLTRVVLGGARLKRANLTGANLTQVDLRAADLSTTELANVKLRAAEYDEKTRLPKSLPAAQT